MLDEMLLQCKAVSMLSTFFSDFIIYIGIHTICVCCFLNHRNIFNAIMNITKCGLFDTHLMSYSACLVANYLTAPCKNVGCNKIPLVKNIHILSPRSI